MRPGKCVVVVAVVVVVAAAVACNEEIMPKFAKIGNSLKMLISFERLFPKFAKCPLKVVVKMFRPLVLF